MENKLKSLLGKIKKNVILVVGDTILDCNITCHATRMSAEAPIPVFNIESTDYSLGGAANVALNLLESGQYVTFCSVVGCDSYGELIRHRLDKAGVDHLLIADDLQKTTVKNRYYTNTGEQVFRADSEDVFDISKEIEEQIASYVQQNILRYHLIVLSDYQKGCLTDNLAEVIINTARKHGIPVLADPKLSPYKKYYNCNYLKPNRAEFGAMAQYAHNDKDTMCACAAEICRENHNDCLIITMGGDGILSVDGNGDRKEVSALAAEVKSVSGAGDTVIAYLAAGIASGMELYDAILLANYAAGIKIQKRGAVPISCEEIRFSLNKCVAAEDVPSLARYLHGKKVVFTNGCFDLLHTGHIKSLQQAAEFGDVLVVGINSDSSVKRLKGELRPLVPLKHRIEMLAALECVDYIIPFEDDTPIRIISDLVPQVLVKGSDYTGKVIVGEDVVVSNGGKVCLTEMIDGFSTTQIVTAIQNAYEKK